MTDKEWLDSLKVGDRVAIASYGGGVPSLATITKLTPTQIVVGESRFRRKDGYRIGDPWWSRAYLTPPTLDHVVGMARNRLSGRKWSDDSPEVIEQVAKLVGVWPKVKIKGATDEA